MDGPDVTQLPQTPSVNNPASGTYGVKAAADQLRSALDTPVPQEQAPGAPPMSSMPGGAKPSPSAGPFGLPAAITSPTSQPNTPVSTPLAQPVNPVAQAGTLSQKNRAMLDMLANNPDVSDETREWAMQVLRRLVGNDS